MYSIVKTGMLIYPVLLHGRTREIKRVTAGFHYFVCGNLLSLTGRRLSLRQIGLLLFCRGGVYGQISLSIALSGVFSESYTGSDYTVKYFLRKIKRV